MANQIGKKYSAANAVPSSSYVTKGGNGQIVCCGQPMEQKK